jgi:RNA polymerase sigma factor (sigma-70 family)
MRSVDLTSLHVREAIGGSRESLGWVVAHFDPLLEAQIRLRLRGTSAREVDVEDLRAETWVVTVEQIGRLEPREGRFAPVLARFLTTTALHLCSNFLRRRIRQRVARTAPASAGESASRPTMDRFRAPTIDALQRAAGADERRCIATALAELPEEARDVIVLRLFDQRTNQEIAAALGVAPNTIAVRYKRALEKLRAALAAPTFAELWSLHRFREAPG